MTKIMNGEALPANLQEAISHYNQLREVAKAVETDDDHATAFAAMEATFDSICDGKFPILDETDASALLDFLADEANDAMNSGGSFVDEIVLELKAFLAKRAALTDRQAAKGILDTWRWLMIRRELVAIAAAGHLKDNTMDALIGVSNMLAEDIINKPAQGEEGVKAKLALVQDLVTDEAGESMLTQRAIQATFDAVELLKVRRSKLVDVLVDLSCERSSTPEAAA